MRGSEIGANRKNHLLSFASMEGAITMRVCWFCLAASDMAGAAALAVFCGIVLMGGRAVVSRPLRVLSSLYRRGLRRVASDLALIGWLPRTITKPTSRACKLRCVVLPEAF